MTHTVFTICSANYLPTAKVLLDSLRRYEPDRARVLVLVERDTPDDTRQALGALLGCEVLGLAQLPLPDLARMAFQYDITEFNTAVKPFVFQYLFDRGDEAVIYLDPDICLYQPLAALWQVLATDDAVVTPHITAPLPDDGLAPSTENMLRCGQYNFGFVGLARRPPARRFVDWWAERLTDHCIFHPRHFYFVDQFYGALVSSVVPATRVWHHPGYNFAYWNAPQRTLARAADGGWTADGEPLVFFHFSGFTADDPAALSRHQNRLRALPGSALEAIARDYGAAIEANRAPLADYLHPYSFGQYHDGQAIDPLERLAYRDLSADEKARLGDPFDPALRTHLALYQEVDGANGSAVGLTWEVWGQQRRIQDLQAQLQARSSELAARTTELEARTAELATRSTELATEQQKYRESEHYVQLVHASASYRLGRGLLAPARLARPAAARAAGAARGGGRVLRRVVDYRRTHGWGGMLRTGLRVLRHEGLRGVLWRVRPLPPEGAPQLATPRRMRDSQPPAVHTAAVDIIVCIHNALDDVRRCLNTVLQETPPPYQLILVDDGSGPETAAFVRDFAEAQGLPLIRNEEAGGYTRAANCGLRASTGAVVVLLNSDTIVSPGWLDRMLRCLDSDAGIGVVGPLSNAASWQSVPQIFDAQGDWYDNPLPEGTRVADMAAQVAALSAQQYPRVGFLNGFCYVIRRAVLDEVGLFDEDTFGRGFGEENDYSLRAAQAGWQLVVADDAYVFHAQSRSYTTERRLKLSKLAGENLSRKHGDARINEQLARTRDNVVLAAMRARMAGCWEVQRALEGARARHEGRRVLFILPVMTAGGGGNVVIQEACAMMAMGVDVRLVNLRANRAVFERYHPDLVVPVEYLETPQDLDALLPQADAVVGTLYLSVQWIADSILRTGSTQVVAGYYIQDYEPHFFAPGTPEFELATASYTLLPQLVRITKTQWNRAMVERHCGVDSAVVGCSYDVARFMPITQPPAGGPVRITAMVRPATPRRAPERTLKVLKTLHERLGDRVQLRFFGVDARDPALARLDTHFPHTNLGALTAEGVANLLDDSDVFLDYSTYQAMGLTALEAMACGVAVVAPQAGGAGEIVRHEQTGLLVDTADEAACIDAALRLATDDALRRRLQAAALAEAPAHRPEFAAARTLDALFPEPT